MALERSTDWSLQSEKSTIVKGWQPMESGSLRDRGTHTRVRRACLGRSTEDLPRCVFSGRLDRASLAPPPHPVLGFSQTPTQRYCSPARVLHYLRRDGDRGSHSLQWSGERHLYNRASHQRDGRRSARRPGPQEPAQCTRSRRTTAEVDGIDKFHLAAQGVRGRDGALPLQIKNLAI
jgi:hypothetical protein